ncbi:PEP-CTERM sorting domain-containing protein [Pseudoroseomonas wenyumeiae]
MLGSLTSSAGGTPGGFLNASGLGFGFRSSTDGNLFSGNFTAALGACTGNGCDFNGTVVTTVPEPSALSLMAFGAVALLAAGYRKRAPAQPTAA